MASWSGLSGIGGCYSPSSSALSVSVTTPAIFSGGWTVAHLLFVLTSAIW
jgi:hypothetical protein